MTAFFIILLFVGLIYLLRYLIRRDPTWIFRTLLKRKIKKMQKQQEKSRSRSEKSSRSSTRSYTRSEERIIPPEYGEDVEYVEIKDFSRTSLTVEDSDGVSEYSESQISDAEWIEIK